MNSGGFFFGLALLFFSGGAYAAEETILSVYTYDSFAAKGGLGPELLARFPSICGCQVKLIAVGDGGQLLSRLQLDQERGKRVADLVIGIDEQAWERIQPQVELWGGWAPKGYSKLVPAARIASGFLPYDYGFFAFMADTKSLEELKLQAPSSLRDLLKPEWKRNVILEDPRTSTPGLAFLLYANAVGGADFFSRFRSQWLTLAPGWDQAYGLFLKKEAPLVWSYTTSQAYHEEKGDSSGSARRYRALVFSEGQPIQIEGAAIVKGVGESKARLAAARKLLEFLITPEFQEKIPLRNWMYPALQGAKLPASFERLPQVKKTVRLARSASEIEATLVRWRKQVEGAP